MAHAAQVRITTMIGAAVAASLLVMATPLVLAQSSTPPPATPSRASSTGSAPLAPTTSPALARGIHFVAGPADGLAAARASVERLRNNSLGDPATMVYGPVLPVYDVTPADIAAGAGLSKAVITGSDRGQKRHRYLVQNGGRGVGHADIITEGERSSGSSVGISAEASNILQGLEKMAALPEVKAGSFEARYLTAGPINGSGPTRLLWLKADQGNKDLIYTSSTAFPPLEQNKVYTLEEFLKIAQPMAQRRVLEGGGGWGPAAVEAAAGPELGRGQAGLEKASRSLASASTNNHGGYIELARADIARVGVDFDKALIYLNNHPEAAKQPAELTAASEKAVTRIMDKTFPTPNNQNSLVNALDGMKTMAESLKTAPGGTLDGNRDKIIANLERSFDNLTTAFDFLAKGNIPKASTAPAKLP